MNERVNYEELWGKEWLELQRIGPLTRTNHRLIVKMIEKYCLPGARLLDVGCGNGALLAMLSTRFPSLSLAGVEGSEQAVANAPDSIRRNLVVQDITNGFRLDHDDFDIVTCAEVLEHLSDYHKALQSIVDHTRSGCHVLITAPHSMRYWSQVDEFAGHYRRFEYRDLKSELMSYGLKPIRYFTWGFPVSFLYFQLVKGIDPSKLMRPRPSVMKKAVANLLYHAMKIDDVFTGTRWHQLIALARKL
jgi:2-polyprenyl-3-methyl-5-hydroxy-6-metoxy-1,4-benzoquinol methylase